MISRAFSLSSAGTTYQGAAFVLVTLRQASYAYIYCFPELSLFNVAKTEFSVFVRLIDAFEEALALFVFREVEEKLDDSRSVSVQMVFQIHDGAIPFLPDRFLIEQLVRQPLAAENLGMHPNGSATSS